MRRYRIALWCGTATKKRSGLKETPMRKPLIGVAWLVLACAVPAISAEDPFTGIWRDRMVDYPQLILAPVSGGISIQEGRGKPEIVPYGEDTPILPPEGIVQRFKSTRNIFRIDNHTLKSAVSHDGEVGIKETATASADGKYFTRVREFGENLRLIIDYERVGSVPSGDAFFGTWKRAISENSPSRTVKVDGDDFEWSALVPDGRPGIMAPGLTGKFDGREYQGRGLLRAYTFVLKRIDARTIEITGKTPPREIPQDLAANISPKTAASAAKGREIREIWQVKGDILTITSQDQDGTQSKPAVAKYERVK
jgi:hypothetical protein